MSLKLHFLHSHLDFFPENVGAICVEHGERFSHCFSKLERGIFESGVQIFWLTAA